MVEISFTHLHVHTEYSLLDGSCRINDLIKRAVNLKMSALAITDHGAMYGVIDFYTQAIGYGIKPLIGCELYLAYRTLKDKSPKLDSNQYHLVVLAKDEEGYRNLLKLVTIAHLEGFYYKPRVDKEILAKYNKGLIALSSCLQGEIAKKLLDGEYDKAKHVASEYAEIFDKDDFYLEIHDHGLEDQAKVNPQLIKLSQELGIPLVATNDVHYLRKEDARAHDVLLCIQTGSTIDDPKRLKFGSSEFYFKTTDEMIQLFSELPEALQNTLEIAEKCDLKLDLDKMLLPHYEVPDGFDLDSYLHHLCEQNLRTRYPALTDEVRNRLNYELMVIKEKGLAAYFLIVSDIVRFAKERGILMGPGRGSAVGSIVSYLLEVSNIDPLAHGLLFERFLNPDRVSMPDFDLDFEDRRRDEVIDYVINKYGEDKVAQIITFGTMAARAAIRDAGRALNVPLSLVDRVAKLIPWGEDIERACETVFELKELYDKNEVVKNLMDTAKAIEGLARHASTHAAGIVISDEPLDKYVPLQRSSEGLGVTTQYHMDALKKIGLLKTDLLGLRNLTVIGEAVRLVKQNRGKTLDIDRIPLDDSKTYDMLSNGESVGVFQFESPGMRRLLRNSKPRIFNDLIAAVALYRPGPLNRLDSFVRVKQGLDYPAYLHPKLRPVLEETYGVIIYQEQVMRIASEFAGFTMAQADILREAMSKKRLDVMEEQRNAFINSASARGVPPDEAAEIFDRMAPFAGYGFNKSHAAAYALIAYQTAHLKANYPVEYMAALLTSVMDDTSKIALYAEEAKRMKIRLSPPDINKSLADFTAVNNSIGFGLAALKNVGRAAIEAIIQARNEGGAFKSLFDFCERVDLRAVNRGAIESLIKSGAFDNLLGNRAQMLKVLNEAIHLGQKAQKEKVSGQASLFGKLRGQVEPLKQEFALPDIPEFSRQELLAMEKETTGIYLSEHPLLHLESKLGKSVTALVDQMEELKEYQEVVIGGVTSRVKNYKTKDKREMVSFVLEDLEGAVEVVVFPKVFKRYGDYIKEGALLKVKGKVEFADEHMRVICDELIPLEEQQPVRKKPPIRKPLYISLRESTLNDELLQKLKDIISNHPGESQTFLAVKTKTGVKKIAAGEQFKVKLGSELYKELEQLLGRDAFWSE